MFSVERAAKKIRSESRVAADAVFVLWCSFRTLCECCSVVENVVGEAIAEKRTTPEILSQQSHSELMRTVSHSLLALLRGLWMIPAPMCAKILMFVVPTVNSFSRRTFSRRIVRIVCWCDVLRLGPNLGKRFQRVDRLHYGTGTGRPVRPEAYHCSSRVACEVNDRNWRPLPPSSAV